jgi:hypothetical protein
MDLKEQFNNIMLVEGALQDLKALLKGDKEMQKMKKDSDFLDKFWAKNEKAISKIEKKYGLGLDELGELLLKL